MSSMLRFFSVILFTFLLLLNSIQAQPVWEKDPFKVYLKNDIIEIVHHELKLIEIHSIEFNFIKTVAIIVDRAEADCVIFKLLFNDHDGFSHDFPGLLPNYRGYIDLTHPEALAAFEYIDYFDNDIEKRMILEHHAGKYIFNSDAMKSRSMIEIRCTAEPE